MKTIYCVVLCVTLAASASVFNNTDVKLRQVCSRGLPLLYREIELQCCKLHVDTFKYRWATGGFYLSRYLELLRTWRCPYMEKECKERFYDFTKFTELTYDRFCDVVKLEEKCIPVLQTVLGSATNTSTETPSAFIGENAVATEGRSSNWSKLVGRLDVFSLRKKDIFEPCVQVAQMDTEYGGYGDYHEIVNTFVPFCTTIWSGFSRPLIENRDITPWDSMSQMCRANIIIIMVVMGLLAVVVILANVIVIVVFSTTPKLGNSQAIYKISLAVADLLVGVVVLPTFAVSLSKLTMTREQMGALYTLRFPNYSRPFIDWSQAPMPGRDGAHFHLGGINEALDTPYIYAVGCITTTSLVVSLYTLMLAGFDRLLAVYKPLHYRRHGAKKMAVRLSVSLWVIATFLSLLPLISALDYGLIASVLIASSGAYTLVVYIIGFLIPLIVVWVTNISIYIFVRKQSRKRRSMATHSINQNNESDSENRLTVTLTIIVGVFTLSALPATLTTLISAAAIPAIDKSQPEFYDDISHSVFNAMEFVSIVILMCNSLWNCFIYSARNKDFKKATHELIHKIRMGLKLAREKRSASRRKRIRSKMARNLSTTTAITSKSTKSTNASTPENRTISFIKPSPILDEKKEKVSRSVTRGDSVFHSFHVNLNADRFFHSVMRRVDAGAKGTSEEEGTDEKITMDSENNIEAKAMSASSDKPNESDANSPVNNMEIVSETQANL